MIIKKKLFRDQTIFTIRKLSIKNILVINLIAIINNVINYVITLKLYKVFDGTTIARGVERR